MEKKSLKAFLIFPVHLFKDVELLKRFDQIYLLEEATYFTKLNFHKLKLIYHRASMKFYCDYLIQNNLNVQYKEFKQDISSLLKEIKQDGSNITLGCYDPVDHDLKKTLTNFCSIHDIKLEIYDNKQFLCTNKDLNEYMAEHNAGGIKKKYTHDNSFYRWQRRRLGILMGKDGKDPSRWTYDTENRKPFHPSAKMKVPVLPKSIDSVYITEAKKYIETNFKDNIGQSTNCIYPIDFEGAEKWLDKFLEVKLSEFGPYQDAVHQDYPFMFHALLSPMMNIGLLTAQFIVDKTMEFYEKFPKTPIQSLEGFIRQVIGWREYVRLLYVFEGEKQKKSNFFQHNNKINKNWYNKGGLGIHFMNDMIKKLEKYSYLHHIERLMYVGNFMLLCGIHPDESYRWFMEYFIDSYDWVMVPNIYGMSQHADGGLMMTRPYFSSSNYIMKMSAYKKGPTLIIKKKEYDWNEVFDALYYNFICKQEDKLIKYYATANSVRHWQNKTKEEQTKLVELAENYIEQYIK